MGRELPGPYPPFEQWRGQYIQSCHAVSILEKKNPGPLSFSSAQFLVNFPGSIAALIGSYSPILRLLSVGAKPA